MNNILVIGGTGTVGSQVLSRLAARGAHVRAMARNPAAARLPPQTEVVRGDLTLPETLDPCLNGIDTVFLVWTAPAAAVPAAVDRIAKQARSIVFLSAPHQTPHPLFQQTNPMARMFAEIERLIQLLARLPGLGPRSARRGGGVGRRHRQVFPTAPRTRKPLNNQRAAARTLAERRNWACNGALHGGSQGIRCQGRGSGTLMAAPMAAQMTPTAAFQAFSTSITARPCSTPTNVRTRSFRSSRSASRTARARPGSPSSRCRPASGTARRSRPGPCRSRRARCW